MNPDFFTHDNENEIFDESISISIETKKDISSDGEGEHGNTVKK